MIESVQKSDLDPLYNFFLEDRSFNQQIQYDFLRDVLDNNSTPVIKCNDLLYEMAYTQSQPKIDPLGEFFKDFHETFKSDEIDFNRLCRFLGDQTDQPNFASLFKALKQKKGWGNKTSALFVRNLYITHIGYAKDLTFLPGVPVDLNGDRLYLPVDAVIRDALLPLLSSTSNYFDKVNRMLNAHYSNEEIEVWDDLWFWGFFGSKTENKKRVFNTFNENKYWVTKYSKKESDWIHAVELRMKEFQALLGELHQKWKI